MARDAEETSLACPFFLPEHKCHDILWTHPARLPLGYGYTGCCTAPGHEGTHPDDHELKDLCNLGYAKQCSRIPPERKADAVSFAISLDGEERIVLSYIFERNHAPVELGYAEYDCVKRAFPIAHPDAQIQKQLECYLASYLERRPRSSSRAAQGELPRSNQA
jgi:hypothetical protein